MHSQLQGCQLRQHASTALWLNMSTAQESAIVKKAIADHHCHKFLTRLKEFYFIAQLKWSVIEDAALTSRDGASSRWVRRTANNLAA